MGQHFSVDLDDRCISPREVTSDVTHKPHTTQPHKQSLGQDSEVHGLGQERYHLGVALH